MNAHNSYLLLHALQSTHTHTHTLQCENTGVDQIQRLIGTGGCVTHGPDVGVRVLLQKHTNLKTERGAAHPPEKCIYTHTHTHTHSRAHTHID